MEESSPLFPPSPRRPEYGDHWFRYEFECDRPKLADFKSEDEFWQTLEAFKVGEEKHLKKIRLAYNRAWKIYGVEYKKWEAIRNEAIELERDPLRQLIKSAKESPDAVL